MKNRVISEEITRYFAQYSRIFTIYTVGAAIDRPRLPLLIKGSCPSAHTGAEGIRTPMFLRALIDAVLQSLSQKSKIFASSLYTREPGVLPHQCVLAK